jgi:hypothetical protein
MIPIEQLREWAGLDPSDSSKDDTLRFLEAASIGLIEELTGRRFACPPEKLAQVLDGPPVYSGGLSNFAPGPQQWVTVLEEPLQRLTGTFSTVAGSVDVVGVGSLVTNELSSSPATSVWLDSQDPVEVVEIIDDLNFKIATPAPLTLSAVYGVAPLIGAEIRVPCGDWSAISTSRLEVEGRRVFSRFSDYPVGTRTVRLTFRHGYNEGEAPPEVMSLVLDMVKMSYRELTRRASTVSVQGMLRLEWRQLGAESELLYARAMALRRSSLC